MVSCDGDGDDAGILLVPKEAEVVLPFIEHFRAVVFQGGTLILTAENGRISLHILPWKPKAI